MNIFIEQPEFIELDPRKTRPKGYGYAVTPEFMYARHAALIPPELVRGKRVLDLGSCLGATGAWCLSHGAAFYQAVEIDEEFVRNSTICLQKYYPAATWSVAKCSIEDFLAGNKDKFDVLIASGILYGTSDPVSLLKSFAACADFLIIESKQSQTIFHSKILSRETLKAIGNDPRIVEFLENEAYIAVGRRGMVVSGNKTIRFNGFNPSMGAIKFIMHQLGFQFSNKPDLELRRVLPEQYAPHRRFALYFRKDVNARVKDFGLKSAVEDAGSLTSIDNW